MKAKKTFIMGVLLAALIPMTIFAKDVPFLEYRNDNSQTSYINLTNYKGTASEIAGESYSLIDWEYWNSLGDMPNHQYWDTYWNVINKGDEYHDSNFDHNFSAYKSEFGPIVQTEFNVLNTAVTIGTTTLTRTFGKDMGGQLTIRQIMRGAKNNIWFLGDPETYFDFQEETIVLEPGEYYLMFYPWTEGSDDLIELYGYIRVGNEKTTTPSKPTQKSNTASPTLAKVSVNQKPIDFEAYMINDSNYIKLRDFAHAISGTKRQFEVSWDTERSAINLISDQAYSPNGSELGKGDGKSKTAVLNTSKIYKNGIEVDLTAYTINNNNYFKLRDIADAFDIEVTWDQATSSIGIDTSL